MPHRKSFDPLFSLFSQSPEKYPVNIRLGLKNLDWIHQHYREQLQAAFSSTNDLIISAEDIGSLEINEIQSLLEFLLETGRDVHPFAVVRDPYTYHCSQLQQQIQSGVPMQPWNHCPQRREYVSLMLCSRVIFSTSILKPAAAIRMELQLVYWKALGSIQRVLKLLEETLAGVMTTYAYRMHSTTDNLSLSTTSQSSTHQNSSLSGGKI